MMTSRSEYRLLLRQDNADERLTPIGYRVGLISEDRYARLQKKLQMVDEEIKRAENTIIPPKKANPILEKYNSTPIKTGLRLSELVRRPELNYERLAPVDETRPELPEAVLEEAEIKMKYKGYIDRQIDQVNKFKKLERRLLPEDINYDDVYGLRIEARQKLNKVRPKSLGQASRISGVSPADMSVLIIHMEANRNK